MSSFLRRTSTDEVEEKKNDSAMGSSNDNNYADKYPTSASFSFDNSDTKTKNSTNSPRSSGRELMGEDSSDEFIITGAGGNVVTDRHQHRPGTAGTVETFASDAAIVMNGNGDNDEPLVNIMNNNPKDAATIITMDDDETNANANDNANTNNKLLSMLPKWSEALSTPPHTSPLYTPASDMSIIKQNLHGLGLKYSIDRTKVLSRTGKNCSNLLVEIAALHEDLATSLNKQQLQCQLVSPTPPPPTVLLQQASSLSPSSAIGGSTLPMTEFNQFAQQVTTCISSFIQQTSSFAQCIQHDIARPYQESAANLLEESTHHYAQYTASRGKCATVRKEAIKSRKRYVESMNHLDGSFGALRKARSGKAKRNRKNGAAAESSGSSSNTTNEEVVVVVPSGSNGKDNEGGGDTSTTNDNPSPTSRGGGEENDTHPQANNGSVDVSLLWEEELRTFGKERNLVKQCEGVIRAAEDLKVAQTNYSTSVAEENAAVDDCVDVERMVLDSIQRLEEERIVFLIGLLDRFLQDEKESLENMSLELTSMDPLALAEQHSVAKEGTTTAPPPPIDTSNTTSPAPSSLFMSPRRRAQSGDGPAINETRMLNLPDNIAGIRDNMKGLIGKQLSRFKALKTVANFNEGIATSIDNFASNLRSQLETNHSSAMLNKNEGANVLDAWNSAMNSLEMYATSAGILARQITNGNNELRIILITSEREAKSFQEKEEFRWKSLCDAARVETKAKLKHKQLVADLEKAKARLENAEGEEGGGGSSTTDDANNNRSGGNLSPMKSRAQSLTARAQSIHNRNLGKMLAILPGGGEDVMNKVLTPQQRQAVTQKQLDDAKAKEEKGSDSFELARSVKQQAVVSYQTEAKATEFKFKSDERREYDEMQKALIACVDSMKSFRDGHLKNVQTSIDALRVHLQGKALEDVAKWTDFTEKRVADQRARVMDDAKDVDESQVDCGFSLKVHLVERTDVKELVRQFLDEKDVVIDDGVYTDAADDAELSPQQAIEGANDDAVKEAPVHQPLPDVPADAQVKKMDPIFSKKLKNVSIDKYYSAGWVEEDTPLYQPWLERKGSFDVSVSDWEESADGGFENVWSGEKFPLKRIIKFKFRRTTHLYIGPPVAGVTQTQYVLKDGNNRCIVMMTVEMDGIPYSDAFAVEVRWAARRVKDNDIAIDAGVFVRFTKSSMFASKIKSGTLKETSPIHLDLFEVIKAAIASGEKGEGAGELEVEEEPEEEAKEQPLKAETVAKPPTTTNTIFSQLKAVFRQVVATISSLPQIQQIVLAFIVFYFITKIVFVRKDSAAETINDLNQKIDDLTKEVKEMKAMLKSVLRLSEQSQSSHERDEL